MGDRHIYWLATVLEGPHLATAESLLGEVRGAVGRSRHLVAQLVKRLADPEPDSNVALLVGHHPDPAKVCEAAVRLLALAQTRTSGAGIRLMLHSGEASLVPWLQVLYRGQVQCLRPADGTPGLPDDFLIFYP